jgi:endoglucanase
MEDFNTALLSPIEPTLQPLVSPLLGIEAIAPAPLSSTPNSDFPPTFEAALSGSAYTMPPGQDALTGQPETFFPAAAGSAVAPTGFIRQQGDKLVDGQGKPMTFKGVAFGNEVWNSDPNPFNSDHSGIDFLRVKEMGMNSVRFYLNYKWFEDDSKPYEYKAIGWQWLDQNISWAKQNGLSLVLNMHFPQGGYQSGGQGDALWNNPANQQRLTALWTTIADRYRNETTIGGYGLLNEPIVTQNKQQWQSLAQNIANSIRGVDRNHLLFVEGIIGSKTATGTVDDRGGADQKMIKINDSNTAYEFHNYDPFQYTYQGLSWASPGDGGKYPDYSRIENDPQLTWYTATFDNPKLGSGTTPWQYFEGVKYKITDPKIKFGIPALVAANVRGTVSYDDIVIREYDPAGKLTNTIPAPNPASISGWSLWSSDGSGTQGTTTAGRTDRSALTMTGTTGDANSSNFGSGIVTKPGYSYQISGWMKGDNVAANGTAQLRLDFQTANQPIQVRDKTFLEKQLKSYLDWGKKNQAPMYMGEFGTNTNTFKNNKGGAEWTKDMIDISLANNLSFNYHAYHGDDFGIYYGSGNIIDPTKVNLPLKQLLTTKLRNLK